jgi:hypothetical protein
MVLSVNFGWNGFIKSAPEIWEEAPHSIPTKTTLSGKGRFLFFFLLLLTIFMYFSAVFDNIGICISFSDFCFGQYLCIPFLLLTIFVYFFFFCDQYFNLHTYVFHFLFLTIFLYLPLRLHTCIYIWGAGLSCLIDTYLRNDCPII